MCLTLQEREVNGPLLFFQGARKLFVKSETEGNAGLKPSSIILILPSVSQYLVNKKTFVQRGLNKNKMRYYL